MKKISVLLGLVLVLPVWSFQASPRGEGIVDLTNSGDGQGAILFGTSVPCTLYVEDHDLGFSTFRLKIDSIQAELSLDVVCDASGLISEMGTSVSGYLIRPF